MYPSFNTMLNLQKCVCIRASAGVAPPACFFLLLCRCHLPANCLNLQAVLVFHASDLTNLVVQRNTGKRQQRNNPSCRRVTWSHGEDCHAPNWLSLLQKYITIIARCSACRGMFGMPADFDADVFGLGVGFHSCLFVKSSKQKQTTDTNLKTFLRTAR